MINQEVGLEECGLAVCPLILGDFDWEIAGCGLEEVMELILTTEEQQLPSDILKQRHRDVLKEISHTHRHEFNYAMRKNERLLESILGHLRSNAGSRARA